MMFLESSFFTIRWGKDEGPLTRGAALVLWSTHSLAALVHSFTWLIGWLVVHHQISEVAKPWRMSSLTNHLLQIPQNI